MNRRTLLAGGATLLLARSACPADGPVATFSIVGCDPVNGDLGVAVQSRFLAVGAVVPFAKAGVGAIATQSYANTTYGPRGLTLLEQGNAPAETLKQLTAPDAERDQRQVGLVNAKGVSTAFTGEKCDTWAGHVTGANFSAQGNILAGEKVVRDMAAAYRETDGDLSLKLLAALVAGQASGGDTRGQQSAALLVVREKGGYGEFNDRFIDLRVDEHPEPIEELQRIHRIWERTFGRGARLRSAERWEQDGRKEAAARERRWVEKAKG